MPLDAGRLSGLEDCVSDALHFLATPIGFAALLAVAVVFILWRTWVVQLKRRL